MSEGGRRRGRPPASEQVDRRAAIVAAALEEFGANGYDGTSVRGVARRAGIDHSLVRHYFGDKAGLFAAVLGSSGAVQEGFGQIFDAPREHLAERYVRLALRAYEDPALHEQMTALVRTALGEGPMAELARQFVSGEVDARFAAVALGADSQLRARLVSSQMLGLFVARYVLGTEPLASASIEEVVAWVAPTIHRYLFEE